MLSKLQSPVIALTTSLITTFTLYVSTLSLIGITAKSNQDTAYVQIQRCPHNFTTDTRYDDQSLQKSATAYTHTRLHSALPEWRQQHSSPTLAYVGLKHPTRRSYNRATTHTSIKLQRLPRREQRCIQARVTPTQPMGGS
jgi:hypothetical protein